MLRKSKRICFCPDINEKPTMFLKDGGATGGSGGVIGNKKRIIRTWTFRIPKDTKFSPVRLLRELGAKVASAVRVLSMGRRSSRRVSSSTLVRSCSLSDPIDSYRAKYVEDCIEILHSSSTRERPSSVSL